eukprot:5505744-Prymnesium_polylepis.1
MLAQQADEHRTRLTLPSPIVLRSPWWSLIAAGLGRCPPPGPCGASASAESWSRHGGRSNAPMSSLTLRGAAWRPLALPRDTLGASGADPMARLTAGWPEVLQRVRRG